MKYRYEMHSHTAAVSLCSSMSADDFVKLYTALNYSGIFITDHFYMGSSYASDNLTWKERVENLYKGYQLVEAACKPSGLQVFFAWEYSFNGTDFLIYGLDKQWLLEHEEISQTNLKELLAFISNEGGFVCQAHPYREAFYIDHIRLYPSDVQAIETYNASRDSRSNHLSKVLAEAYKLPCIGGSDIHKIHQAEISGIEFDNKAKSEQDIINWICEGKGTILHLDNPYAR